MIESGPPPNPSPAGSITARPLPISFLPPAPPAEIKPIPPWMWLSGAAFALLIALLAIPAYRIMRKQSRLGSTTVRSLHVAMRKQDDAAIYNASDVAYQQQVGRTKSDELFDWVRGSLGAPHASTRIGTFTSTSTKEGTVLTLTYETTFDKGMGTETIKLHQINGKYLMLGYSVQSPQINQQDVPKELQTK